MTKLKELEKVGRQAWLATIGTYAKGWEVISGKANETFADTNQLINEIVENGEKIETEIIDKIKNNTLLDDKILALKVKLGVEVSFDDKLAVLAAKVDQLTLAVEKLIEVKTAELAKEEAAIEEMSKLAKEKPAVKKAPVKRTAVKKASAATEATPAAKATRTRRTTAKTKAAEVK